MKFNGSGVYWLLMVCICFAVNCQYPFKPQHVEKLQTISPPSQGLFTIFPTNINKQICNPSISQDTINFRGSMLWLNFAGDLDVIVPGTLTGFSSNVLQHDRLTITDTSNTVKWFMMRDEFGASEAEQLQDPEWSTHPEYISTLLSENGLRAWSSWAVHLKTRHKIKICQATLNETSTPHIWITDTAKHENVAGDITGTYDPVSGFIDKESIVCFFGTAKVKCVYSLKKNNVLSIWYVDYSTDAKPVNLQRPSGKDNLDLESALISPDGNWVVYNAIISTSNYECYVQELKASSLPILIKAGGSDPHWWHDPIDKSKYIIYQEVPGNNFVRTDLTDSKLLTNGNAGKTYIVQVILHPGRTQALSFSMMPPILLVNLPVKGGLSPDMKYLCTGYQFAYLIGLR
jgi:hypothetical protein